jgi:hypothetical protein
MVVPHGPEAVLAEPDTIIVIVVIDGLRRALAGTEVSRRNDHRYGRHERLGGHLRIEHRSVLPVSSGL